MTHALIFSALLGKSTYGTYYKKNCMSINIDDNANIPEISYLVYLPWYMKSE